VDRIEHLSAGIRIVLDGVIYRSTEDAVRYLQTVVGFSREEAQQYILLLAKNR